MLLFKFILLSFFFCRFFHGRSRFLCPDVTLYVHYFIIFSLYIVFLYLFLFVILKFFLNLYHSIISLSVLRYVTNFYPAFSLSIVHCILSFSPISFPCFLCIYLLFFVSFFKFITRYTSFIFPCIFLIPFTFFLASKRNNYTDSEMHTSVFHFPPWSPVINSDVHVVCIRYLTLQTVQAAAMWSRYAASLSSRKT